MALGKLRGGWRSDAFVAACDLTKSFGYRFHTTLNRLLGDRGFDALDRKLDPLYNAETMGQPGARHLRARIRN